MNCPLENLTPCLVEFVCGWRSVTWVEQQKLWQTSGDMRCCTPSTRRNRPTRAVSSNAFSLRKSTRPPEMDALGRGWGPREVKMFVYDRQGRLRNEKKTHAHPSCILPRGQTGTIDPPLYIHRIIVVFRWILNMVGLVVLGVDEINCCLVSFSLAARLRFYRRLAFEREKAIFVLQSTAINCTVPHRRRSERRNFQICFVHIYCAV